MAKPKILKSKLESMLAAAVAENAKLKKDIENNIGARDDKIRSLKWDIERLEKKLLEADERREKDSLTIGNLNSEIYAVHSFLDRMEPPVAVAVPDHNYWPHSNTAASHNPPLLARLAAWLVKDRS